MSDIIEEILESREDEGKLDIESEELKSKEMFRRKKAKNCIILLIKEYILVLAIL